MSTMKFYTDESMSEESLKKLDKASMTNSVCESNMGDLTYDISRSAGQAQEYKLSVTRL